MYFKNERRMNHIKEVKYECDSLISCAYELLTPHIAIVAYLTKLKKLSPSYHNKSLYSPSSDVGFVATEASAFRIPHIAESISITSIPSPDAISEN